MRKNYFLILSAMFCCCILAAQTPQRTYQWQWAHTGGSATCNVWGETLSGGHNAMLNGEQVNDIAVDNNNNIYFSAHTSHDAQFMGHTITGHGDPIYNSDCNAYMADVFIGSVDCAGNYRWHYTIGGREGGTVIAIETDTLGGVYAAVVASGSGWRHDPVYFGDDAVFYNDDTAPAVANTAAALVKLDTLGNLQWIRWICGEQQWGTNYMIPNGLQVEPDGTVHLPVNINAAGVYADGQMTITGSMLQHNDFAVMKYDRNGNFKGYKMLDVLHAGYRVYTGQTQPMNALDFYYNQATVQYYLKIANVQSVKIADDSIPKPNSASSYFGVIAAFDTLGNHLWHYKTDYFGINSVDFDKNSIYMSSCTGNFADIHQGTGVYNSLVIKIYPDGTVNNNYRESDYRTCIYMSIKSNQNEIALQGTFYYPESVEPLHTRVHWTFVRVDTTLTGAPIDSVVWSSNYTGGVSQFANTTDGLVLATDNQGNYLMGRAVGTAFQLSPTVSIANSSYQSLTDFWIGKYAKYECGEAVDTIPANIIPKNVADAGIIIYPNPVKDIINLTGFESQTGLTSGEFTISDLTGKQIVKGKLASDSKSINVSSLSAGVYILKIGKYREKFVKE
jgi:hypothetical protein